MVFQIAAIIILLLFYGCYFGKCSCRRKKESRQTRLEREKQAGQKR